VFNLFNFGWHQALRARTVADEGRREVATLADVVRDLEARVESQAVVLQALGRLLADRLGMTDAEILDYVKRAEAERRPAAAPTCARCGKRLPPRKSRCIYCGEEQAPQNIAEAL
jgi:hypothetical protein